MSHARLTRAEWNRLFDGLDQIREDAGNLLELGEAMKTLGLSVGAFRIERIEVAISNLTSVLQSVLRDAQDDAPSSTPAAE